jgi:hypothetical protein
MCVCTRARRALVFKHMCVCMSMYVCVYTRAASARIQAYKQYLSTKFHVYTQHRVSGFEFRVCNAPVAGDRERAARARRLVLEANSPLEADSPLPALSCLVCLCMCGYAWMNEYTSLSLSRALTLCMRACRWDVRKIQIPCTHLKLKP